LNPPRPGFSGAARPRPHPFLYAVLIAPFGATFGFVGVALAFLATRQGLTVTQGAELVAVGMFPHVGKFLWAPLADNTLTRKRWYLLSCLLCAAGMFAMASVPLGPSTLKLMDLIVLVTSLASTFLGFAVEAMIAHLTPATDRGRVSGWFQAGNLGGVGFGGGAGLWLLTNLPAGWQAGLVLAALTLGCALVLPLLPDVAAEPRSGSLVRTICAVAADIWHVIRSRDGVLCGLLCFMPVGTGAAANVLTQAEVAAAWGAGAHEVELVQGFLTGTLSMIGCLIGGYGCKFFGARTAYVVYGAIMAVVTAAMAVSPANPFTYMAFSLVYALVTGLCFAAFSGFVFDAIGAGNAATKYNGFASLSNLPISYMGLVLAAAEVRLGPKGMLLTESACGVLGILGFSAALLLWRPRPAPAAAVAPGSA
jgi:MFS transporter, PAT family, beta-lactamase induction signal transducer AmpG